MNPTSQCSTYEWRWEIVPYESSHEIPVESEGCWQAMLLHLGGGGNAAGAKEWKAVLCVCHSVAHQTTGTSCHTFGRISLTSAVPTVFLLWLAIGAGQGCKAAWSHSSEIVTPVASPHLLGLIEEKKKRIKKTNRSCFSTHILCRHGGSC